MKSPFRACRSYHKKTRSFAALTRAGFYSAYFFSDIGAQILWNEE
ncbi:ephrin type-A/B receptor [Flavilitoribacter nigricans]|nr:ephrin type-A/B receptor [Flavilitoribacter nigricans]